MKTEENMWETFDGFIEVLPLLFVLSGETSSLKNKPNFTL